ncbi:MAG: monovalent cation/H(+) antiporter subunit G [Oscillospiraceae bacterium]|nr:monovalent cation/H(+) antiporter subunit G [Oscillospiraceae bacterium]
MGEWIRFWITAVLLAAGIVYLVAGVVGNCRFRYVMNRVHAAGLGDTMGLFFTAAALAVSADGAASGIRLFLPLVFLWITSPVSSHFLSQIEYFTQKNLFRHMDRR